MVATRCDRNHRSRRRRTRGCDGCYETIPVMDAGNDILAVAGERDLTGKDAAFV